MTRKELREYTLKIIFQHDFYPQEEWENQVEVYLKEQDLGEKERTQVRERGLDVLRNVGTLDKDIERVSEGWTLKRMNKVDLALIRLAYYEMQFDDQVPVKVAINEAVEMAKTFGGDNSPQFVNGVLAKLVP